MNPFAARFAESLFVVATASTALLPRALISLGLVALVAMGLCVPITRNPVSPVTCVESTFLPISTTVSADQTGLQVQVGVISLCSLVKGGLASRVTPCRTRYLKCVFLFICCTRTFCQRSHLLIIFSSRLPSNGLSGTLPESLGYIESLEFM